MLIKLQTMKKSALLFFATLLLFPGVNKVSSATAVVIPVSTTGSEPSPEEVKKSIAAFKSLSKKEKKNKLKYLNRELKTLVALKEQGYETDTNTLLLLILAILLPPLAVYLHQGELNTKFWISLLLWILGWVVFSAISSFAWLALAPAILYSILVILGNV